MVKTTMGVLIIGGLAVLSNPKQAVMYGASAITVYGASFLAHKIAETTNKTNADIIAMTGKCLVGVPLIGIIKLSLGGVYMLRDSFYKVQGELEYLGQLLDKLTPWS